MKGSTTTLLLDQWKKRKGVETDYAAAKALHITPAAISKWRKGKGHAEVELAAKMAGDLNMSVIEVLAAIEADRAKSPQAQEIWRRYGKAAFMTLVVGFALPGSLAGQLQAATAVPNQSLQIEMNQSHYAKWYRRR